MWWMERAGVLDDAADPSWDRHRTLHEPSLQLAGYPDRRSINLETLQRQGVRVAGRITAIEDGVMQFKDDLAATVATAQSRLARLIARLDACVAPGDPDMDPGSCRPLTLMPPPVSLDLVREQIGTIVWATGYRRNYGWLHVPVLDAAGEIVHSGGVTPSPGLYVMGLRFMRRRKSSFLDGVGADAVELAEHIYHRPYPSAGCLEGSLSCHLRTKYDALVVGARCAGAATAMLLARRGMQVIVIDRAEFGTDTISTHALMRGGVMQLHRWGVAA